MFTPCERTGSRTSARSAAPASGRPCSSSSSSSASRRSHSASTTTARAEPPPWGQLNKRHAPPRALRCLSSTPNGWRRRRIPTPTCAPTARTLSPGCLGRDTCAISWRALEFTRVLDSESDQESRRATLARAGAWLGSLPPRLALEQDDALRTVASRCGYSVEAVERAFRARYWQPPERPHAGSRENLDELTHER